jgi:hypothetical protein
MTAHLLIIQIPDTLRWCRFTDLPCLDNLQIRLALSIFDVMQSFQQIVTQAKYEYNLSVHAFLRFCFGLSTYTLPENAWDVYPATPR